jgi:hypothetical protein
MSASLDVAENPDEGTSARFPITNIIGIHETFDLALLRVEKRVNGLELPEPLKIGSAPPGTLEGHEIYVIGYPGPDPRAPSDVVELVFGDLFFVKRLEPGRIMASLEAEGVFNHDCSTLGGNSGSCVIDLETSLVVGLHFKGFYLKFNQAIALWKLINDPLLEGAALNIAH